MKKILAAIVVSLLFLQTGIGVAAAPTSIPTTGLVLEVQPNINLEVKQTGTSTWNSAATISSGETVDVKASINMTAVRTAFESWYNTAIQPPYSANPSAIPVTGTFNVTLEFPQGVTLPAATIAKTDLSDFNAATSDLFTANGARVYVAANLSGNQELTIPVQVKSGVTVGALYSYTDPNNAGNKYFPDMNIVTTGAVVAAAGAPHSLFGKLAGSVDVNYAGGSWQIDADINFVQSAIPEAVINVVTPGPGPGPGPGGSGGGVTSYTITFETNGGAAIEAVSFRGSRTVISDMLPVPTREGYTFDGWYLDAELTEKADSILMKKDITLYAAWKTQEAPGGEYVPEMLNGDDHFAYIIGYPDGTIKPDESITRAEVVTIFYRLLKDEIRDQYFTTENEYVDVKEGAWYNGAISTLTAMGIVNGKDGEIFAPNADITRGEFAAIISRFATRSAEIAEDFADVDGHWAETAIYKAAAFGWIKGYEDNTFRPDREITRAETMTLINRVLGRVPETVSDLTSDMAKWSDNSDTNAWFYIAVQEATNSHDYTRKENGYEKWDAIRENRDWSLLEK